MNKDIIYRNISVLKQAGEISKMLSGLDYAYIRSLPVINEYPEILKKRKMQDIDIITRPETAPEIEKRFLSEGFTKLRDSDYLFYREDLPVPVDVHTSIFGMSDISFLFSYVEKKNGLSVVSGAMNTVLLLLNHGLAKGYMEDDVREMLGLLVAETDLTNILEKAASAGVKKKIVYPLAGFYPLDFPPEELKTIRKDITYGIYKKLYKKGFIYGKGFFMDVLVPFTPGNIFSSLRRIVFKDGEFYRNRFNARRGILRFILRIAAYIPRILAGFISILLFPRPALLSGIPDSKSEKAGNEK